MKYLLILIVFWQCSAQETKIQDGEWIQLKISKNDTIIFKPCLDENRKLIIRNDSLIDFNGQEKIACKIKANFERKDWTYIVLEEKCSYSDTIAFKNYKNNIIEWKLYNNLSFFTTKKEFAKNYKTVSEKCADEDISEEKTLNTHLFLSSFIKVGITSKNIISAESKNIIESTVSNYTTMTDYGSNEFYIREGATFFNDKISSENVTIWNLCLSKLNFEAVANHDELESDWRYPYNQLSFAKDIMNLYKDTSYGDSWQHIASTPKYHIALYLYYLPWKKRKDAYEEIDRLKTKLKDNN